MKKVMHVVTSRDFRELRNPQGKKRHSTVVYSSLLTWISAAGRAGMNIRFGSALGGVRVLAQTGQAAASPVFPSSIISNPLKLPYQCCLTLSAQFCKSFLSFPGPGCIIKPVRETVLLLLLKQLPLAFSPACQNMHSALFHRSWHTDSCNALLSIIIIKANYVMIKANVQMRLLF